MTDADRYKDIAKAIELYTKKHTKSQKTARAALIREGIYSKSGRLKDKFNEALDYQSASG